MKMNGRIPPRIAEIPPVSIEITSPKNVTENKIATIRKIGDLSCFAIRFFVSSYALFTFAFCSRCNTVLVAQSEVSAKGHVYGEWKVVTPATEESEGKKEKVCACGDKVEEVLPKLEKQSGCKSSVVATVTVVAIVSVLGSAVVLKKKD